MSTKPIPMIPVSSSQIHSIGHDSEANRMAVRFLRGGAPGQLYHYENVTQEQYDAFATAKSLGTHFGQNFRTATDKHPYTKVDESKKD